MKLKTTDYTAHAHGSRIKRPCLVCAHTEALAADALVMKARIVQAERAEYRGNMKRAYNAAKRIASTNWLAIYETLLAYFLADCTPLQYQARIAEVRTVRIKYRHACQLANVAPDYAKHMAEWLMVRTSDTFVREYEVEPELTPIQEEQARYAQATALTDDEGYDGFTTEELDDWYTRSGTR